MEALETELKFLLDGKSLDEGPIDVDVAGNGAVHFPFLASFMFFLCVFFVAQSECSESQTKSVNTPTSKGHSKIVHASHACNFLQVELMHQLF